MEGYHKTQRAHRKKYTEFLQNYFEIEDKIEAYNPDVLLGIEDAIENGKAASANLSSQLAAAEHKVQIEEITISQINNTDTQEISYMDFHNDLAKGPNIYEVIKNHEDNHKTLRTSEKVKAIILRKHLLGSANLSIPIDMEDYEQMKELLI